MPACNGVPEAFGTAEDAPPWRAAVPFGVGTLTAGAAFGCAPGLAVLSAWTRSLSGPADARLYALA